jgi:hypothetical protein
MSSNLTNIIKPVDAMFIIGHHLLTKEGFQVYEELNGMDLFGINNEQNTIEIEIKSNCYDLYKEHVKKAKKHWDYNSTYPSGPNRFYFLVNKTIVEKTFRYIKKQGWDKYGIIYYDVNSGEFDIAKKGELLHEVQFDGGLAEKPFNDFKHKRNPLFTVKNVTIKGQSLEYQIDRQ